MRIDDGILDQVNEKTKPIERTEDGTPTKEAFELLMEASEEEVGPWYAVHHGFEVQICDIGGEFSRTGSIYSLAKAAPVPDGKPNEWRTMVITLKGELVSVEVDGKQISTFDSTSDDTPTQRQWHEPKREPRRPVAGYIGLQNHDPGDVVYFKEVSVRSLSDEQ